MNITVDTDESLQYEANGIVRGVFNRLFLLPFNLIPKQSRSIVRKSHKSVDEIVQHATTHHALEILYKKGHKDHSRGLLQKLVHHIWFNTGNSRAVRNRLRLVKRELTKALKDLIAKGDDVSILSIASGSARAVVESILDARPGTAPISAIFLDKNPQALEYSKELLHSYKLDELATIKASWVNGTAETFVRSQPPKSFNVIEMVGLLDYFDDEKAVSIFSAIRDSMKSPGVFITANICPNPEEAFITKTIDWRMIYRTAEDLGALLLRAGFQKDEIALYYEPLKVHVVAVVIIQ
jgi:hypothetical protein